MSAEIYKKICQDLIAELKNKEKEVILRRFGLEGKEKETLQSIGDDWKVTRERVRQIQVLAEKKIKSKFKKYQTVFQGFENYFQKWGGIKREEILLEDLGKEEKNEIVFLLTLNESFQRFNQNREFYSFWTTQPKLAKKVKEIISSLCSLLAKKRKLLRFEELIEGKKETKEFLISCLEISKKIQKNEKGLYGLKEWPEINPKRIRDKAYLIFKELQKPLHFAQVAQLMKGANLATVHNELIRDDRFVLVGRGIYALKEWGYYPGEVKDVILRILKEEKRPLTKEEIIERVKKQRIVKENTILLNLANKNYFLKDTQGRYTIKTAEI